jgi:NADPH2:quinone reductase
MRAWRVHEWGEPETMRLDEVDEPSPGPGEIKIRNRAAALNFFDILQVQGKYQIKPPFPFIPGAEVAGIVEATGAGVDGFRPGDRVMAMPRGNGFAEFTVAKASSVFSIPKRMSFEEAVSMLVPYHTSYFALRERTQFAQGETLLVHAAASGVGVAALQIGKALGARVLATAGSRAKLDFARSQGAEESFDYSNESWVGEVKKATGSRGADVIYDPVGGDIFDLSTKCIAPEGRLLVIGFAGGRIPTIAANRILLKNISVVGVLWGAYVQEHPHYPAEVHTVLAAWYSNGLVHPVVGACSIFEDAPCALRDLASRKICGKAVLSIANR